MDITDLTNMNSNDDSLEQLTDLVATIMSMNDDAIANAKESLIGMFKGAFSSSGLKTEAIKNIKNHFEQEGFNKEQAAEVVETTRTSMREYVDSLQPSIIKREVLNNLFDQFLIIYDEALNTYHNAAITLAIKLDDGAQAPTYAHENDAAADIYALKDTVIPAHSISNKIRTGVHIQLPDGWMAMIFPRSSIGVKTGLRLSNSAGIIDTGYLGEIGVLYDNISDSDYTIKAGDRIAQMMVMPSYQFRAKIVDDLVETERSTDGFGSTGK